MIQIRLSRSPYFWSILSRLKGWRRNAVTRRHLRNLTPAGCADVGLHPEAAQWEAARPFWSD